MWAQGVLIYFSCFAQLPLNAQYTYPIPQSPDPSPSHHPSSIDRVPSPIPRPLSANPFEDPTSSRRPSSTSPTSRDLQPGIDQRPTARSTSNSSGTTIGVPGHVNAEAGSSRSASISTVTPASDPFANGPSSSRRPDFRQSSSTFSSQDTYHPQDDYPHTTPNPAYDSEPGWKGPSWRGGAGALTSPRTTTGDGRRGHGSQPSQGFIMDPRLRALGARDGAGPGSGSGSAYGSDGELRKDKWWYALCAWGNELDDGEDGQAGKTNPME